MRAPAFWGNPPEAPGWQARALAPLAAVWTAAARRRLARGPRARVGAPVICVGNLTAGGAGKTPMAAALALLLADRGVAAHVVSRGHGGRMAGPVRVDPRTHRAQGVGDEPLLLAAFAPTWIGRDRPAAARAAVAAGARAVILDDGLQNPGLAQDLALAVVDAGFGFGNGRVMPAGPLREPVATGLARADLALIVGEAEARERVLAAWPALAETVRIAARLAPLATGMDWRGLRAFAFAGIGRPEKFFATLRGLGAELAATRAFPDHAVYHPRLLARLARDARALGAQLVTTEKDAVRLPPAFRPQVLTLPVRMEIEDPAPLLARLATLGL